jgi:hypothetical protein
LEIAEAFRGVHFVTDFRNVKRTGVREKYGQRSGICTNGLID